MQQQVMFEPECINGPAGLASDHGEFEYCPKHDARPGRADRIHAKGWREAEDHVDRLLLDAPAVRVEVYVEGKLAYAVSTKGQK